MVPGAWLLEGPLVQVIVTSLPAQAFHPDADILMPMFTYVATGYMVVAWPETFISCFLWTGFALFGLIQVWSLQNMPCVGFP